MSKARLWLVGLILVAAGVGMARGVTLAFEETAPKVALFLVGGLMAIAGLLLITMGMRTAR